MKPALEMRRTRRGWRHDAHPERRPPRDVLQGGIVGFGGIMALVAVALTVPKARQGPSLVALCILVLAGIAWAQGAFNRR